MHANTYEDVRDREVLQSQFPAGYIAQRHRFILGLSLSWLTNNVLEPILIAAYGLVLFNVFTSIHNRPCLFSLTPAILDLPL